MEVGGLEGAVARGSTLGEEMYGGATGLCPYSVISVRS
jgi:hypothetical protein